MNKILLLAAATLSAVASVAQAPSCNGPAPAGSLITTWVGGVYLGTTSATVGFNQIFDLTTNADLTISQVDLNFYDNGTPATNPILTGLTTTVEFYTCPTTAVGNYTNTTTPGAIPAAWTLAGTGTVTIQAPGTHSPAIFTPFSLPAGSYGVALHVLPVLDPTTNTLVASHPLYTNPASTPGTATVYTDQYMTLTARGYQGTAWTGTPALRVWNGQIYYQPGVNAGYTTAFGAGCYNLPQSYYERLVGPGGGLSTTYDLSNTTLSMINQGNNYLVYPGVAATIAQPTSAALTTVGTTWDDDITAPQTLPFSFPYPGGSTTQIIVSTNGHVFLGSSTATFGPYNMAAFFSDVPRLACAWSDLDLTTTGSMHFDVDPNNQFATVTWWNCPEWDPNTGPGLGGNTFQIVMWANGNVDYIYNNVQVWNSPLVIGFARGNGTADPGSIDLSALMPFTSNDGRVPPVLGMDTRPVAGNTMNFVTTGIDSTTTIFGVLALSFGSSAGIPLDAYGMPGCFQYVALPAVTQFAAVVSGSMSVPLTIPNAPAFNGVNLFAQAAPLTPGLNAANIITSNGLCVHIGLQ
jgi:hypothetical protein